MYAVFFCVYTKIIQQFLAYIVLDLLTSQRVYPAHSLSSHFDSNILFLWYTNSDFYPTK